MPRTATPPRTERVATVMAVLAATTFVAWHLHPGLLFSSTITTGGDTASHYLAASWLRHELLPAWRLTGWFPGNYAGFPLFQVYFPLPFVVMAATSLLTGLPVAFKLVSAIGLIGLPVAVWAAFRLLRLPFPAPALGAVFSVLFLFHEGNSVWGGNIASTLAGEFTYSFGMALLVVFAGTLYRGATSGTGWIGNGLLLAAIGLSHAYTLLAAAAFGGYLVLLHPAGRRVLPYLAKVAVLAFGLMAFWAVPLVAYAGYTTAYSVVWPINGFVELVPPILWPPLGLLVVGVLVWVRGRHRSAGAHAGGGSIDHRLPYVASLAVAGVLLYLGARKLEVVDIRFLPFAQLTLTLLGAPVAAAGIRSAAGRIVQRRAVAAMAGATLVLTAATLGWAQTRIAFVDEWAAWNYGGFEATPGWSGYRAVNDAVERTAADPRVAYEHSSAHLDMGTVRAFESLPLFSGASTLEGLYMQSTISSPFVFYIQSEISQIPSCPLLPYHCGRLDPGRAAEHLRLFNVTEVIARSDVVTEALSASPDFTAGAAAPPFRVFHVTGTDGSYVVPVRYQPLVLTSRAWKAAFFDWFKRPGSGDVPLVHASPGTDGTGPIATWDRVDELPDAMPRRPLTGEVDVRAELSAEQIRIHTSQPGRPLLVKVSYHPRWRVEGADRIWLASPSFMLLVPEQEDVTLVYGDGAADRLGQALTALAVAVLIAIGVRRAVRREPGSAAGQARAGTTPALADRVFGYRRVWAPCVIALVVGSALAIRLTWIDPWVPHRQGLELFHAGEYDSADPLFLRSIDAAPSSAAAYYSFYYHALCAFRTTRWHDTLSRFTTFIRRYPDGELVPEGHFRVAEALQGLGRPAEAVTRFEQILDEFPDTQWARFAVERLAAAGVVPSDRSGPP